MTHINTNLTAPVATSATEETSCTCLTVGHVSARHSPLQRAHTASLLFLCLSALCYFPKPIIIFISAWRLRPVGLVPEASEPAVVQWFVMTSWQRRHEGKRTSRCRPGIRVAAGCAPLAPQLASWSLVSLWRWGASVRPELHLTGEDQSPTLMQADTVKYPLTLCAALPPLSEYPTARWSSAWQITLQFASYIPEKYISYKNIYLKFLRKFCMKWYANVMLM